MAEGVVFDERGLSRALLAERARRVGAVVGAVGLWVALAWVGVSGSLIAGLAVAMVVAGWVWVAHRDAVALRDLAELARGRLEVTADDGDGLGGLAAGADEDEGGADGGVEDAEAVSEWDELTQRAGVSAWVRLLVYQGLSAWRERRGDADAAAAIAAALCRRRLGPGEAHRPELLLTIAESALRAGKPEEAYGALLALHGLRVSLGVAVKRMAAQTRYEVAIGRPDAALYAWARKAAMAELLSPKDAARVHADLADAAEAMGHGDLAAWLRRRQRLLTPPVDVTA
ncbi:MAG: hypothetical protein AAF078_06345 [Planctomycetota bacterium]